jgi:hypothetical protein
MKRGTASRRAMVAVVVTLALTLSSCSQALADRRTYRVCRHAVSLRHAPAGVTIGYLHRGDRVIVTLYARRHRWAFGISAAGQGWLLTSALCRR